MSKKKFLGALGAIVLLIYSVGLVGCSPKYPEYNFDGRLGDEQVKTSEVPIILGIDIAIEITKSNGSMIIYQGYPQNLELHYLTIVADGKMDKYNMGQFSGYSPAVKEMLSEAQKQFREYAKKIVEAKISPFYKK